MRDAVAGLIWTEDDVIGIMKEIGLIVSDKNIKKAIKALENNGMSYSMQCVNEDIMDIIEEDFIKED